MNFKARHERARARFGLAAEKATEKRRRREMYSRGGHVEITTVDRLFLMPDDVSLPVGRGKVTLSLLLGGDGGYIPERYFPERYVAHAHFAGSLF